MPPFLQIDDNVSSVVAFLKIKMMKIIASLNYFLKHFMLQLQMTKIYPREKTKTFNYLSQLKFRNQIMNECTFKHHRLHTNQPAKHA